MTAKLPDNGKNVFKAILTGVSGVGLWLFLKSGIVNYITFRMHFAFLDYTTAKWLIILQNLSMLLFCAYRVCAIRSYTKEYKVFSKTACMAGLCNNDRRCNVLCF
jgi:hypothetical protein